MRASELRSFLLPGGTRRHVLTAECKKVFRGGSEGREPPNGLPREAVALTTRIAAATPREIINNNESERVTQTRRLAGGS